MARSLSRALVLVVEDHADSRASYSMALRAAGFEVAVAEDGAEGIDLLARLQAEDRTPSVILLDLLMPRMDGFEFRARQLGTATLAMIPTVVVSGCILPAQDVMRLRPALVLLKPVALDVLIRRVLELTPTPSGA